MLYIWKVCIVTCQFIFLQQCLYFIFAKCIIVCGNRFRITVDDDCLESKLFQGKGGMNTTIVKFDTLTNSVRSAAKNHNLRLIIIHWIFKRENRWSNIIKSPSLLYKYFPYIAHEASLDKEFISRYDEKYIKWW